MDSVSPSSEPSHDQWLTLSLSIAPHSQAQEQPRSQPQLLELLQTQPQPRPQPRPPQPQLLHLLQTQPQPRPPQPQLLDLLQTQPQPQPQPQPQLLDLLQTQPQPRPPQPQLLDLLQTQPQQPPPSPPDPFPNMPLVAPMRPSSLPPYQQEPRRQETYFLAPPFIPHPPSFHVHNLPQTRMLPFCDRPLLLGHQDQDQDPTYRSRQLLVPKCQKPTTPLATKKGKTETIDPPFPWATSTRATVYSLEHLLAHNIRSISGTVKCKQCDKRYDIEFDLEEKFRDVVRFVVRNRCNMHNRAPGAWMNSKVPTCKRCGIENVLRPVITKKRNINWLFLLLGQMIGCCTHAQLKYFCKHRLIHCTAAKDRLVYLTYLDLCKQLQPRGPFNP